MATNQEKLTQAFATSLNINPTSITDELRYATIPQWDSVAHMALVAELERVFEVMLDTEQIIDMSTVAKAKEILGLHGIPF